MSMKLKMIRLGISAGIPFPFLLLLVQKKKTARKKKEEMTKGSGGRMKSVMLGSQL